MSNYVKCLVCHSESDSVTDHSFPPTQQVVTYISITNVTDRFEASLVSEDLSPTIW